MNKLKNISNKELHEQTVHAAEQEKCATLNLLEHIAEVEFRRMYAEYGYDSLWAYVMEELKYSGPQASERIHAMRMMKLIPEIKEDLKSGNLNLTSTVKLSYHIKKEKLNLEETKSLLMEVAGKSTREVEKILESKTNGPRLTKIVIEVDDDFLRLMERVKELKGHNGSKPEELFAIGLKEIVKKEEKQKKKFEVPVHAPEVKSKSRYVPVEVKVQIKERSGNQCEYISPIKNKRCGAKTSLEFDHIHPFARGGETSFKNLRHFCKTHNLNAAIKEYGEAKIKQHFK